MCRPSLCRFAGDDKRVGVATSRLALTLSTSILRLQEPTHPIHSYADKSKWTPVEAEAKTLLPHLKAAFCMFHSRTALVDDVMIIVACMFVEELIASAEQRKRARKSETGYSDILSRQAAGKSRTLVQASARYVHAWLKKSESPLRKLLAALSDGGCFFTASTHARAGAGAVLHRAAAVENGPPGLSEEDFVRGAQVHLCDGV